MKKFLFSILLFISFCSYGQLPSGFPTQQYAGKWSRFGQYLSVDSGLLINRRDTNWIPRQPGAMTFWSDPDPNGGNYFWGYNGTAWKQLGSNIVINAIDTARWNYVFYGDTARGIIYFSADDFAGSGNDSTNPIIINPEEFYRKYQVDSAIDANKRDALANAYRVGDSVFGVINNQPVFLFTDSTGGSTIDTSFLRRDINLNTAAIATKADKATTITINGTTYDLSANRSWTIASGSGTVTSVGLQMADVIYNASVTNSPVTTTGTLTPTLKTQAVNTVLAGPTTGSAATPSFRSLISADIPSLAESKITNLTTDLNAKLNITDTTGKWINDATAPNDSTLRFWKGTSYFDAIIRASPGITSASIVWPGSIYSTPTTGVISTNTLTFSPALASQTTNKVLAAPNGSTGVPTFRALVPADIPLSLTTTGTTGAATYTGGVLNVPNYAAGGGGASVAGANTQIQYNASGSFGASSTFTFNPSTTAASNKASAFNVTPTITAAANNDTLIGATILPVMSNVPAYTNIQNIGLKTTNIQLGIGAAFAGTIGITSAHGLTMYGIAGTNRDAVIYDRAGNIAVSVANGGAVTFPINIVSGGVSIGGNIAGSLNKSTTYGTYIAGNAGTTFDGGIWDRNGTNVLSIKNGGSVGIGAYNATYAATSILDIQSTTKGVLFPRMTTTQRTAITLDATNDGLMVYDITLHKLFLNENGTWVQK